jgi:hypothetical protein
MWSVYSKFFFYHELAFAGVMLADFAEFVYKFIFYPHFFANLKGFFDYFGYYGSSTGRGNT